MYVCEYTGRVRPEDGWDLPRSVGGHEGLRSDKRSKAGWEWEAPEDQGKMGWRVLQFKAEVHRFLLWL